MHRDNCADVGNRGAQSQNFLDHLGTVGRNHFSSRVADDVGGLLGSAGGVERYDDRAEPEHGLIDDDPFGAIVGKDRDAIAGAHAQLQQTRAQLAGGLGNLGPRMVRPDLVALLFQERARAILLRIRLEVLGKRRHTIRHNRPGPPLPQLALLAQRFVAANRATSRHSDQAGKANGRNGQPVPVFEKSRGAPLISARARSAILRP